MFCTEKKHYNTSKHKPKNFNQNKLARKQAWKKHAHVDRINMKNFHVWTRRTSHGSAKHASRHSWSCFWGITWRSVGAQWTTVWTAPASTLAHTALLRDDGNSAGRSKLPGRKDKLLSWDELDFNFLSSELLKYLCANQRNVWSRTLRTTTNKAANQSEQENTNPTDFVSFSSQLRFIELQ
jgi:hypothetical protein